MSRRYFSAESLAKLEEGSGATSLAALVVLHEREQVICGGHKESYRVDLYTYKKPRSLEPLPSLPKNDYDMITNRRGG